MKFDRKTMGKIVLLMLAAAVIFIGMMNLGTVFDAVGFFFSIIMPFTVGLCIAFILNIPMKFFEDKLFAKIGAKKPDGRLRKVAKFLSRPVSMILAFIFVALLITLVVLMIVPEIGNTVKLLTEAIPKFIDDAFTVIENLFICLGIVSESMFELKGDWDKVGNTLLGFFNSDGLSSILGPTTNVIGTTYNVTAKLFGVIFDLIMSIVFAIYVLATKEKLSGQVNRVFGAFLPDNVSHFILKVASKANVIFSNFVSGQLTEAIILGSLCCVGMTIMKMPYAVMVSVLVGVTALIPVVGAFAGAIVGGFLILIVDPIKALWFVVFILILQQVEGNVIYPRVVGKSVGLSGMWVLLAITIGSSVGGAVGMLVSVPTFSLVYTLLGELVQYMLVQRGKVAPEDAHPDDEPPQPKPLHEVYKDLGKLIRGKKKK